MTLLFAILTKNAFLRSYGTVAYILRTYIRNINMRRYITSARGHELSGRVRAMLIIIMPGLNARGLQNKLLITPLVSEAIIIFMYCRYGAAKNL